MLNTADFSIRDESELKLNVISWELFTKKFVKKFGMSKLTRYPGSPLSPPIDQSVVACLGSSSRKKKLKFHVLHR